MSTSNGAGTGGLRIAARSVVLRRQDGNLRGLLFAPATLLVGISVLALLLRLLAFQGFLENEDNVFYVKYATQLAHGHFIYSDHWALRLGIVAPTALLIRVLGIHEWSIILFPLCMSLLSLPLIFRIGATLFNPQVGLLAALLLACCPENIEWATVVDPNLTGAFLGATAVYCAYRSGRIDNQKYGFVLVVLSGLLQVASYMAWEVDFMFVPICLAACWGTVSSTRWLRILALLGVVSGGVAIESLAYWHITGNPFWRFLVDYHTASVHLQNAKKIGRPVTESPAGPRLISLAKRWPLTLFNPGYPAVFLYSVATVWALFVVRARLLRSSERLLLLWLVIVVGFVAFGVVSLHPITAVLGVEPRYLDDANYPAIILIALAIYSTRPLHRTPDTVAA